MTPEVVNLRNIAGAKTIEGSPVRLADGGEWILPVFDPRNDPECAALLAEVSEAEDRADLLRAELALTVWLLRRNYELSPAQFEALLSFPEGDPRLSALQATVHQLVCDAFPVLRSSRTPAACPRRLSRLSSVRAAFGGLWFPRRKAAAWHRQP